MIILDEVISSRNNPTVKWAASLSDKKGRDAEKAFIVEGKKLVFEALDNFLPVKHIFVAESKKDLYFPEIMRFFKEKFYDGTKISVLSDSAFEKISTEKAPQGIISVIKYLDFFRELDIIYKEDFFLKSSERAIILSSLRDPGNLGSVIRSAVAFGAEHIILSKDSADIYNPKTVRAAMGSLFKVKVSYVSDLVSLVASAKENGRRVFAAELSESAVSLSSLKLLPSDIFIIGNEGHGISKEISSAATKSVYIPISASTESLNAAVAAGIFMWEQSKI